MHLRPITDDERVAFLHAVVRQFGDDPLPELDEPWSRLYELDRTIAGFDGDRIVATAAVESYRLAVPGGTVGCAGVTAVGVRTDHRRKGTLTEMMRRMLDQAHERGEPVAALYASEEAIYGRYGFGPSVPSLHLRLRATEPLLAVPVDADVRLADIDEAMPVMRAVYEQLWERQPGMLARGDARWVALLGHDAPGARRGASARYHALAGDRGYAVYRLASGGGDDGPDGTVRLLELLAADPESYAALWQFLCGVDLFPNVEASLRPPDEPLAHMLRDPERLRARDYGAMWLRLVDVGAALAGRAYAAEGALVIEVADAFRPHNEGRWALEGGPDGAACAPTDRGPDLTIDVAALASVYLGGHRWGTLARARRAAEHTPGALATADAMFACDPLPWNPSIF